MDRQDIPVNAELAAELCALADSIWDEPEVCFEEAKTSRKHRDFLARHGFAVESVDCGLDTAYVARWGAGKPVIAFLAEMDALHDMSQRADARAPEPLEGCEAGHGCGHHLMGTGAIGAAILFRDALQQAGQEGTVLVIGCPAEENGSGKSVLARHGVFGEVDLALMWHPSVYNVVCTGSGQSYVQTRFRFTGKTAHAAVSPQQGRSALSAVELMNAGIARMREHLLPSQQVHYAITCAGGVEPNIVQGEAEEICLARASDPAACDEVHAWLCDIARGAALMTQTEVEHRVLESAAGVLSVRAVEQLLERAFEQVPPPSYTEEETEYLSYYKSQCDPQTLTAMLPPTVLDTERLARHIRSAPICDRFLPGCHSEEVFPGSSDVGDVSRICPTGVINTACFSYGAPPHSWLWTAQGKSSPAHKGMLYAAKVLAAAARMALAPEILNAIRQDWQEQMHHQNRDKENER